MITKTDIIVERIREISADEGQNSKTYLVYDTQLDTNLVMKEFGHRELGIQPCIAMFEHYPYYFKESRMLNKSRHPNVLPVLYAGFGENIDAVTTHKLKTIRIVTKFLENGSLDARLRKIYEEGENYPSLKEVVENANQILQGLSHIHQQGILHLDLKPTNILIEDNEDLVITDFGQSKFINPSDTYIPDQYKHHLAPEIIQGHLPQVQTDIYQFGLTLYRICCYDYFQTQLSNYYNTSTGFDETRFKQDVLTGNFPDRNMFHHFVPKGLREIINKCLEVNPVDRYNNVSEILCELNTKIKDFGVTQSIEENLIYITHGDDNYELEFVEDGSEYEVKVYKKTAVNRTIKHETRVRKASIFNKIWQLVVSSRRGTL